MKCKLWGALLATALAPAVQAQSVFADFNLGVGAQYTPDYIGSDNNETRLWLDASFNQGALFSFAIGGDDDPTGFILAPSLGYVPERDASEYSELTGLADVNNAFELGAKVGYRWDNFDGYIAVRQGFDGHEGITGEVAGTVYLYPTPASTIEFGPRIRFGDEEFTETYFNVSRAEANNSNFRRYDADGGIYAYGVEASYQYELTPDWAVEVGARYEKLLGDVEDSPIVRAGTDEVITGHIGAIRRFRWGF